ncbi:hypothetical protein BJ165DRAFT_1447770 [Panaeolus papilionaceus]|nr:hypothetical protein BJ165DRAFT_1447770 [Panaeolus papilionaceus]
MSSLLSVYVERGQLSKEEFDDWYDNEHIPRLLRLPGIHSAQRYTKTDSLDPTYIVLYNLSSSDAQGVLSSPEFMDHVASASEREKNIMTNLPVLNRRIYQPIFQLPAKISGAAARYIFTAEIDPLDKSAGFEQELNAWYNNVHIPDISKTDGWVSSRRFQLQENLEFGTSGPEPRPATKYFAIHEFTNDNYMNDAAMIAALTCEETLKLAPKLKVELRHFVLHKDFQ